MGIWDIHPIAVNVQMLLEILNWIGIQVYGAANNNIATPTIQFLVTTSFLMGIITVAASVLTSSGREKMGGFFKHLIITMVIITAGFSIPVRLRINDLLLQKIFANPNIAWETGNVPFGLALPLFLTTEFEYAMTKIIDDNFTERYVPVNPMGGDEDYLKLSYGGGVGAVGNILLGLQHASAQDPRLVINTMTFAKECLIPAVVLKVIPPAILARADNLQTTIANNLLINYFADYEKADGTVVTMTCEQFYNQNLAIDIQAANNDMQGAFVRAGFNAPRLLANGADVVTSMMVAADSLLKTAYNNNGLNGNTMVLNAWLGRMIDLAVSESMGSGDPLVQAMSEKLREFKSEKAAGGLMALTWLPKIKGALLCLLCGLWIALVPFMFLYGNRVLISWTGMLLWLSIWGVMLTIINGIYTHELVDTLTNLTPALNGSRTMTFGNRFIIWNAASETLTEMGMILAWVIPLSGIIMGWLSTKSFGAAGTSHVVEQQIGGAARGVGEVVSSRGAQDHAERNVQAATFSGGGQFGPNPGYAMEAAKYNTARVMGRVSAWQEHGSSNIADLTFGEIDASMGGIGRDTIGQGFSQRTGLDGMRNAHARNFETRTSGLNARVETFGGVLSNQRSSLEAAIANNDSKMLEHRESLARMHGISVNELQKYGEIVTGDANWGQSADKTNQVTKSLSRNADAALQVMRNQQNNVERNAGLDSQLGYKIAGSGVGSKYELGQKIASGIATQLNENYGTSDRIGSNKSGSDKEFAGIIDKIAKNYQSGTDLQTHKQKLAQEADGYQTRLEEKKGLSHSYNETVQLESGFRASSGYDLKERLFGHFVNSGHYLSGINPNNISASENFNRAVGSFVDHMKDDNKRSELMKDYLKNNSPLSDQTVGKAFSTNGATSEGVKNVDGVKDSEAAAAKWGKMLEHAEKTIIPVAQGMKEMMETLGQKGRLTANAAGMGELYDRISNTITSAGPGNLKATEAAVQQEIATLGTEKERQIATHAMNLAKEKVITDTIMDPVGTGATIRGWIKDKFSKTTEPAAPENTKAAQPQSTRDQFNAITANTQATISSALDAGIISNQENDKFHNTLNTAGEVFRHGDQMAATLGLSLGAQARGADNIREIINNNKLSLSVGESANRGIFKTIPSEIAGNDMKTY
ncbi:MAG: conjugal transfer protein TraG N-terminal domain-containing protein [Pseudomonadota bacterium]